MAAPVIIAKKRASSDWQQHEIPIRKREIKTEPRSPDASQVKVEPMGHVIVKTESYNVKREPRSDPIQYNRKHQDTSNVKQSCSNV